MISNPPKIEYIAVDYLATYYFTPSGRHWKGIESSYNFVPSVVAALATLVRNGDRVLVFTARPSNVTSSCKNGHAYMLRWERNESVNQSLYSSHIYKSVVCHCKFLDGYTAQFSRQKWYPAFFSLFFFTQTVFGQPQLVRISNLWNCLYWRHVKIKWLKRGILDEKLSHVGVIGTAPELYRHSACRQSRMSCPTGQQCAVLLTSRCRPCHHTIVNLRKLCTKQNLKRLAAYKHFNSKAQWLVWTKSFSQHCGNCGPSMELTLLLNVQSLCAIILHPAQTQWPKYGPCEKIKTGHPRDSKALCQVVTRHSSSLFLRRYRHEPKAWNCSCKFGPLPSLCPCLTSRSLKLLSLLARSLSARFRGIVGLTAGDAACSEREPTVPMLPRRGNAAPPSCFAFSISEHEPRRIPGSGFSGGWSNECPLAPSLDSGWREPDLFKLFGDPGGDLGNAASSPDLAGSSSGWCITGRLGRRGDPWRSRASCLPSDVLANFFRSFLASTFIRFSNTFLSLARPLSTSFACFWIRLLRKTQFFCFAERWSSMFAGIRPLTITEYSSPANLCHSFYCM